MTTQVEIRVQCTKIRECFGQGMTPKQIIEKLGLPKSTFYERLEDIKNEDYRYFLRQDEGLRASLLRNTIEKISELERKASSIASDPNSEPKERLAALQAIRQFILDRVSLILNGPATFHLLPSFEHRKTIVESRIDNYNQGEKKQMLEKATQTDSLKNRSHRTVPEGMNPEKDTQGQNPEAVF